MPNQTTDAFNEKIPHCLYALLSVTLGAHSKIKFDDYPQLKDLLAAMKSRVATLRAEAAVLSSNGCVEGPVELLIGAAKIETFCEYIESNADSDAIEFRSMPGYSKSVDGRNAACGKCVHYRFSRATKWSDESHECTFWDNSRTAIDADYSCPWFRAQAKKKAVDNG